MATRYKVTRNCCASGNCIKCITARRDNPNMKPFEPIRVTQLDYLTREKAETVAFNFRAYGARVESQEGKAVKPLIHEPSQPIEHKIVDHVMNMVCNSRHYKCSCGFTYCEHEEVWRDQTGVTASHPYRT